jgi:hypothetical protein
MSVEVAEDETASVEENDGRAGLPRNARIEKAEPQHPPGAFTRHIANDGQIADGQIELLAHRLHGPPRFLG